MMATCTRSTSSATRSGGASWNCSPSGEQTSGELTAAIQAEFGITQPAVSAHLRVLRESGFATVRAAGARRLYAVDTAPLREVDEWLGQFRRFWEQRLDALATELARGCRDRRRETEEP